MFRPSRPDISAVSSCERTTLRHHHAIRNLNRKKLETFDPPPSLLVVSDLGIYWKRVTTMGL